MGLSATHRLVSSVRPSLDRIGEPAENLVLPVYGDALLAIAGSAGADGADIRVSLDPAGEAELATDLVAFDPAAGHAHLDLLLPLAVTGWCQVRAWS